MQRGGIDGDEWARRNFISTNHAAKRVSFLVG